MSPGDAEWRREVLMEITWIAQPKQYQKASWVRIQFAYMGGQVPPEDCQQMISVTLFTGKLLTPAYPSQRAFWWRTDGKNEQVRKLAGLWGVEPGTVTVKTFVLRPEDYLYDP
jgi:hypothetical protein